jgi:hypothetical protein
MPCPVRCSCALLLCETLRTLREIFGAMALTSIAIWRTVCSMHTQYSMPNLQAAPLRCPQRAAP